MAILEGGHIVPPLHSSYIQKLHAIRVKKVKVLLIFYGPLPPTFYLVKPKLLALPPPPPKVSKNCILSGDLIMLACLTGCGICGNRINHKLYIIGLESHTLILATRTCKANYFLPK